MYINALPILIESSLTNDYIFRFDNLWMSSGQVSVHIHTAVSPPAVCVLSQQEIRRVSKDLCNKGPAACKAANSDLDESGLSEVTGLILVIFL